MDITMMDALGYVVDNKMKQKKDNKYLWSAESATLNFKEPGS